MCHSICIKIGLIKIHPCVTVIFSCSGLSSLLVAACPNSSSPQVNSLNSLCQVLQSQSQPMFACNWLILLWLGILSRFGCLSCQVARLRSAMKHETWHISMQCIDIVCIVCRLAIRSTREAADDDMSEFSQGRSGRFSFR